MTSLHYLQTLASSIVLFGHKHFGLLAGDDSSSPRIINPLPVAIVSSSLLLEALNTSSVLLPVLSLRHLLQLVELLYDQLDQSQRTLISCQISTQIECVVDISLISIVGPNKFRILNTGTSTLSSSFFLLHPTGMKWLPECTPLTWQYAVLLGLYLMQ